MVTVGFLSTRFCLQGLSTANRKRGNTEPPGSPATLYTSTHWCLFQLSLPLHPAQHPGVTRQKHPVRNPTTTPLPSHSTHRINPQCFATQSITTIIMILPHIAQLNTKRIVLASGSPRRKELLKVLGLNKFEVRPSLYHHLL